tara:strand:- start:2722 stop:4212 length:1491 start_codon:yes stop_codon:yes gene_type:complete
MARQPKLNWESGRGKWKVEYRGKKHRFDGGLGKSDREAKRQAESEWKRLKAELDHEAIRNKPHRLEYEAVIAEWNSVLTWSVDHEDEITAALARDKLQDLEERLGDRVPSPLCWADRFFAGPAPVEMNEDLKAEYVRQGFDPAQIVEGPVPFEQTLWKDRLEAQNRRTPEAGVDDTFMSNVEQFLSEKRTEVAAGQLSAARADTLRVHLDVVMKFTGRTTSVCKVDASTLSGFRNHLLQQITAGKFSNSYAHDILSSFKSFLRWLANNTDKLEHLPKNIEDKRMRIAKKKGETKVLEIPQVQEILKKATTRTKLYILLGLNCAMTQQDMSDLHPDEVDWSTGIITRKRSKTNKYDSVPTVSYPLWEPTFELLKKERSPSKERVLLTSNGKTLKTERLDSSNKIQKTDAVRSSIRRLAENADIDFTLKMLKKTSASLIRNNRDYQGLESLFLDHAPVSMADKHYTTVPQDLLNEAVLWLGDTLGINDVFKTQEQSFK